MDTTANTIQNKALARLAAHAPANVMNAITKASTRTGVNFAYMVQQASAESAFDPKAKARSSSASGLYQFIESTWLRMVKKHGAQYGMAEAAAQISDKGKVTDRQARKDILALRNDPEKASAMAAEFARENKEFLEDHWGGQAGPTELYFAHFMGAGGAASFLRARDADPTQTAAVLFPDAARANRNVFYNTATGRPKTMDEVYAFFDRKFDIKGAVPPQNSEVMMAAKEPSALPAKTETPQVASLVFTNVNSLAAASLLESAPEPTEFSFASRRYNSLVAARQLVANPVDIMFLSKMDLPARPGERKAL